ncbi:MAG: DUF4383 domain-containing protein, partial [Solirubrobacterales bacterium]|nr:DUF4383 domain-containing protein [Solirubrobacterales bacterium]
ALGERASRVYSLVGGAAYVIVALAGLALEMGELLLGLLPVNAVDTILHGALGAVGLAAWAAGPLRPRAGARA